MLGNLPVPQYFQLIGNRQQLDKLPKLLLISELLLVKLAPYRPIEKALSQVPILWNTSAKTNINS